MKHTARLRSFLCTFGSAMLAITSAKADILYWDGATPGGDAGGGTGTWDNSASNWSTAATGGSADTWSSSPADFAIFGGTAGAVGLGAPIVTTGLQFNVHSYSITADTTNTLNFASGNNTISTNFTSVSGNTTSINGTVGGTGANLLFSAVNAPAVLPVGHMISFGGTSATGWNGTTTIEKNMIVRLQESNQALVDSDGITLQGGIIVIKSGAATATLDRIDNSAAISSYGGSIRTAHENLVNNTAYSESLGNLTLYGGHTVLLQDTRLNNGGTSGMSGLLAFSNITRSEGSFATLYAGARDNLQSTSTTGYKIRNSSVSTASGTNEIIAPWLFTGNNTSGGDYGKYDAFGNILAMTYTGTNSGAVEANFTTSWASDANFNWNGTQDVTPIDLDGTTGNRTINTLRMQTRNNINLNDQTLATNGIITNGPTTIQTTGAGYLTAAGNSGSGNAIYLASLNANITLTAPIKDNGNPVAAVLTTGHNGARIDLNGANEHTGGTIITAVGVRLNEGQGTAPGRVELNHTSGLGANTNRLSVQSGLLDLNGISATVGVFEGNIAGMVTATNGNSVLTVGNGTTANQAYTFAGTFEQAALTKIGDGTLILSGINNVGSTNSKLTSSAGTLQIARTVSLFNNTESSWIKTKLAAASGATLAFNVGGTGEFTAANINTIMTNLGGSNASGEGYQVGSRLGLDTTNAVGGTFTQGNAIADSTGAGGGAIGLTKLGTGTLVLDKANTYTGATLVSGGTLALGASGSIAGSSSIKVGTGATFDVSAVSGGWSLGSGKSLGGDGTVTGAATFNDGSIFSWNLSVTTPGSTASATVADTLSVSGDLTDGGDAGGSVFKILLSGSQTFADNFWNASHSWENVLTSGNSFALQNLFTSFSYANAGGNISGPANGTFSLSGSTLSYNFTAIPEPTTALAGLLLTAGLLRRRRTAR